MWADLPLLGLQFRAREVVAGRMEEISRAILERDFDTFARITMQDSNQFHACCLDTYPPISYLSDTSRFIMALIHWYNDFVGETQVCYTFDAGLYVCMYSLPLDGAVLHLLPRKVALPSTNTQTNTLSSVWCCMFHLSQGLMLCCTLSRSTWQG